MSARLAGSESRGHIGIADAYGRAALSGRPLARGFSFGARLCCVMELSYRAGKRSRPFSDVRHEAPGRVRFRDGPLRLAALLATPPLKTSGFVPSPGCALRVQFWGISRSPPSTSWLSRLMTFEALRRRAVWSSRGCSRVSRSCQRSMSQTPYFVLGVCLRPSGPALGHFRLQVRWVGEVLAARGIESAYCFGDGPRHPSRWQRYTSRAHPDLSFEEAAVASLRLVQVPSLVNVIAAPMGRKKV